MGAKRLGGNGNGGEMTRVCGAKRLGLKIEAKRLGGKRLGGKRLGGETSCYHQAHTPVTQITRYTVSKCKKYTDSKKKRYILFIQTF